MREEEELDRFRLVASDGSCVTALALRYVDRIATERGPRLRIGASFWRLSTGEALQLVDRESFVVTATGELLHRDALA